jgi:DNA polymerase-3 subunit alpha
MKKRALIFDVETTGFLPSKRITEYEKMPHILQLSFIVYDLSLMCVVKILDIIIKIDPSVVIRKNITKLTGITREQCDRDGVSIQDGLCEFYREYMTCDYIVGHNIGFDKKFLKLEISRHVAELEPSCPCIGRIFDKELENELGITTYCTMQRGRKLCNLVRTNVKGREYIKSPKLAELYEHLFGKIPENLHNSIVDTYATMGCFLEILRRD